MDAQQLYQAYLLWEGERPALSASELFRRPLTDFDLRREGSLLVNRLYYAVPRLRENRLECFLFYEENFFQEESLGDLRLLRSSFHLEPR